MGAKFKTLPCQVCGRRLSLRSDGLVKPHKAPGDHGRETGNCRGTDYRHDRWQVGQELQHHTGSGWVVVEDRGGEHGDYLIRCVTATWLEGPAGKEVVAHGEYMHRHGWWPTGDDCMCGCGFDCHDHRRHSAPCRHCEDFECSGYEPDLVQPTSSTEGTGEGS